MNISSRFMDTAGRSQQDGEGTGPDEPETVEPSDPTDDDDDS